jgi:catechol 2,3-dioxygenase-like lactoylglutathione lyase family enzyme
MLIGVDHVQLAMPAGEEDAARRFYVGLLGLTELEKPEPLRSRGGCWFENDLVKVHLGVEADFRPAKKAHPGLLVDDLATLIARAHAQGVATREDEPLEGYIRVFMNDPFGNRLEFLQKLQPRQTI